MAIVPASPPSESKSSPANVRRANRRGLLRMSAANPARIRIAPSAPNVTAARKNGEVASSDDMAEPIICQVTRINRGIMNFCRDKNPERPLIPTDFYEIGNPVQPKESLEF